MRRALVLGLALVSPGFLMSVRFHSDYVVRAMKARLYFEQDGALGDQELITGNPNAVRLWNTIIGAGPAGRPSRVTLVEVQVVIPGKRVAGERLRFTARDDERTLLAQTVSLEPFFASSDSAWVPFFVFDTGCGGTLTLTASAIGPKGAVESTLNRSIDFACGE